MDINNLRENQENLIKFFELAPMKRTFKMVLTYDKQGCAAFDMPYQEKFNHALGSVHGGVISTLLDNAGWFTVAPYYDYWISTVDLQVQFLKHTSGSKLTSIGEIVKVGKNMSFTRMELFDEEKSKIAVATGTFLKSSQKIDYANFRGLGD